MELRPRRSRPRAGAARCRVAARHLRRPRPSPPHRAPDGSRQRWPTMVGAARRARPAPPRALPDARGPGRRTTGRHDRRSRCSRHGTGATGSPPTAPRRTAARASRSPGSMGRIRMDRGRSECHHATSVATAAGTAGSAERPVARVRVAGHHAGSSVTPPNPGRSATGSLPPGPPGPGPPPRQAANPQHPAGRRGRRRPDGGISGMATWTTITMMAAAARNPFGAE